MREREERVCVSWREGGERGGEERDRVREIKRERERRVENDRHACSYTLMRTENRRTERPKD